MGYLLNSLLGLLDTLMVYKIIKFRFLGCSIMVPLPKQRFITEQEEGRRRLKCDSKMSTTLMRVLNRRFGAGVKWKKIAYSRPD